MVFIWTTRKFSVVVYVVGVVLCDILFSEEAQTKRKGVEVSGVHSGNKVL